MDARPGQFVTAERGLGVLTIHLYPLQLCYRSPVSPTYPTDAHLLAPLASRGLANSARPAVTLAHAHGLLVRVDEMNSLSCGVEDRVAPSFASALWSVDVLFEMARAGLDGVNIHSYPGASSELFTFRRVRGAWHAFVRPDYFGLLMFAQAAPPGSRLLEVSGNTGRVKVWATRAPDGRIRVVLINEYTAGSRTIALRVPGASGTATLERLQAPSLHAHSRVTLGGQGFGSNTTTGQLAGKARLISINPRGGSYPVEVPAASAAMLTFATSYPL